MEAIDTAVEIRTDIEGFLAGEPGLYSGVPESVYHRKKACSNSALTKIFNESEKALKYGWDHPTESTKDQIFGRQAHACVLENDRFGRDFDKAQQCNATTNDGPRCSSNGKNRYGGKWYCGTHEKKIAGEPDAIDAVSETSYEKIDGMLKECKADPDVNRILSLPSHRELSGLWIDPATGLLCKMRIDIFIPEIGAAWDYKTIGSSIAEEDIEWAISNWGYNRQGSLYWSGFEVLGINLTDFGFIFQEKTGPFECQAFRIQESALRVAALQLRDLMKRYKRALETDAWPGKAAGGILSIGLPEKVIQYDLSEGERSVLLHGSITV